MIVTAIKQMAHKPGLFRISIDNKPVGFISAQDVANLGIVSGSKIDSGVYSVLAQKVKFTTYYHKALLFADRRLHSKVEVKRYLKSHGCDIETTEQIIDKLVEIGVIDEMKLANAFVNDAKNLKPMSAKLLRYKLKEKQIDPEIINETITGSNYDNDQALDKLIASKQSQYLNEQPRFFRYLLRQGFSYSDIAKRIGSPERPKF